MDTIDNIGNLINILTLNQLSPEIAGLIFALGASTLFIFFFRTDEWREKLSELDKLILSGLVGYMLWAFLIVPITFASYILSINYMPEPYSFQEIMGLVSFTFIIISTSLVVFPKSCNFNNFIAIIDSFKSGIEYLILFSPMAVIFFSLAFYFSNYRGETIAIAVSLLLIEVIWIIWYLILTAINNYNLPDFDVISLIRKNKGMSIFALGLLAASTIGGILVGVYCNNPSTINSSKLERIEISNLIVNREYGNLSANFIYNTTYKIKYGWIKWTNIESNYTISEAYDADNNSKKYEWSNSLISLRGNDKVNVTILGYETQNISKNFYTFTKKYSDSYQEWNITFNNTNKVEINVKMLDFLPRTVDDEKLRFINISSDNIYYSGYNFDNSDNINKYLGRGFTIFNVLVEPNEKKSITLYFGDGAH